MVSIGIFAKISLVILYGRNYELTRLWETLEQGEHILMLAPRRVGKTSLMLELRRAPRGNRLKFRSNLLRKWWRKYHARGGAP